MSVRSIGVFIGIALVVFGCGRSHRARAIDNAPVEKPCGGGSGGCAAEEQPECPAGMPATGKACGSDATKQDVPKEPGEEPKKSPESLPDDEAKAESPSAATCAAKSQVLDDETKECVAPQPSGADCDLKATGSAAACIRASFQSLKASLSPLLEPASKSVEVLGGLERQVEDLVDGAAEPSVDAQRSLMCVDLGLLRSASARLRTSLASEPAATQETAFPRLDALNQLLTTVRDNLDCGAF